MFASYEGRSWVWTEDKRDPGGGSMGGGGGDGEGQFWASANGPPTDILVAAYVGALDSVKAMIAEGEGADSPDLIKGSTPLHWASFGGHLDVVRWLVKEAGADVNRPNKDGCTPLLFACERGHAGVAQWLVREGGAQVNVKDDVTWQTPLHRVCLNSQRRSRDASFATEDEDFALWLVDAGADLGAVDRFGNHVEDLCAPDRESDVSVEHETGESESTMSRSSICDMILAARLEEETMEGAADNLKRQRTARRRSSGSSDMVIQLSPKLEAKHRTPGGRKIIRKVQGQGQAEPASPSSRPYRQGVAKAHPRRSFGGAVGGAGGAAAPATGAAAARMGGGPPAPSAAGDDEEEVDGERGLLMGAEAVVRGGGEVDQPGGASTIGHIDEMMAKFGGGKSRRGAADREHQSQTPPPDEGSRRHQQPSRATAQASASGARRKLDHSGQQVVEKLRELSLKKASGLLSDKDFTASKRQLLEMEQLRREAEAEDRRRAQGLVEDNLLAISTSVGQNTPPPSPKHDEDTDTINSDFDALVRHPLLPFDMGGGGKDRRETYRASDIDRYTTKSNYDAPRVFGEVPVNVKESLAAKEATSLSREVPASVMEPRASVGTSSSAAAARATTPDTAASSNDTSSNAAELATSKAKPKVKQSELEISAAGTGARGTDNDILYDTNGDAAKNMWSRGGDIDAKGLESISDGDLAGVGSNSEPAALYRSRSVSSRCRQCVCVIA